MFSTAASHGSYYRRLIHEEPNNPTPGEVAASFAELLVNYLGAWMTTELPDHGSRERRDPGRCAV